MNQNSTANQSAEPVQRTTILFVDDEEAVLRSIARILTRSEFTVVTTTRPQLALEMLAKTKIDVVVSDIDMPEMNGLAFLQRVRTQHPNVLRMLLTGSATVERALQAINEGEVVRFFRKPFDVEVFRRSLEALVQRIDAMRALDVEEERRRRALALQAWIAKRFPDLLDGVASSAGPLEIDSDGLTAILSNAADPQLRKLAGESDWRLRHGPAVNGVGER